MKTVKQIEEIVKGKVRENFPGYETEKPAYFHDIIEKVKEEIVNDYNLEKIGSDDYVRSLIQLRINDLKKELQ